MTHKDGPVFVEFVVAQEDNVYPMIPAGMTVNEMLDNPDPTPTSKSSAPDGVEIITIEKGKALSPVPVRG